MPDVSGNLKARNLPVEGFAPGKVLSPWFAVAALTGRGQCLLDLSEFAHVKDQGLRCLLQHWLERRGAKLMPARTAIDPAQLGSLLPNIWMCDYLPQDRRFRMRLAGEDVNQVYGRNIGHCDFEEIISPDRLDHVLYLYRRVIEEPAILHNTGHIYLASGRSVVGERLVLPLTDETGAVMHAIGASIMDRSPPGENREIIRESMTELFTPLIGPAAD